MKPLIIAMATLLLATPLSAQKTATPTNVHVPTLTDLFARAPRTVFPLLDRNTRLDMIDYYNSGLTTPSRNLMGGESRITAVTDRSLEIAMTASSSYRMTLLTAKNDTVIALVRTVLIPTPDDDIQLFTTSWQPLPSSSFTAPDIDSWLTSGVKGTDSEVVSLLPFMTSTIAIDGDVMTLRPSLDGRYVATDSAKVSNALRRSITYRWNGSKRRFIRQK